MGNLIGQLFGIVNLTANTLGSVVNWVEQPILNVVLWLPLTLATLVAQLYLAIATLLSGLAAMLLKWAIHLNIPLTRCEVPGECIVDIGWKFSREFANLTFIVILVGIAFAYILRLETFGMKKALPTLLIVALLLNFSQIFVGVIVDISQILMNTFTANFFDVVLNQMKSIGGDTLNGILHDVWSFEWEGKVSTLMKVFVMGVFNFVLALVLFFYVAIFIIRIIALWLLTMVAPLAFVALILPMTKSWFSKWIHEVLSWAFVGVIALFFLYFGFYLLSYLEINADMEDVGSIFDLTEILKDMLPYGVVLYFLYIGYKLAKSTAPAAAKAAIGGVEKLAKIVGGVALGAATAGVGMAAIGALGKVSPETRQKIQNAATAPSGRGPIGAIGGWTRRKVAGTTIEGLERAENAVYDRERKRAKEENFNNNERAVMTQTTKTGRSGTLTGVAESKDGIDQIQKLYERGRVSEQHLTDAYKYALEHGNSEAAKSIAAAATRVKVKANATDVANDANNGTHYVEEKEIKDASGNVIGKEKQIALAHKFGEVKDTVTAEQARLKQIDANDVTTGGLTAKDRANGYTSLYEKTVKDMDPEKAGKGWQNDKQFMEAATKFWGGAKWAEAGRTLGKEFEDSLIEFNKQHGGLQYYINNKNMALPRYLASSGAASLGLSPMKGAEKTEDIKMLEEQGKLDSIKDPAEKLRTEIRLKERRQKRLKKIGEEEGLTLEEEEESKTLEKEIGRKKITSKVAEEIRFMDAKIEALNNKRKKEGLSTKEEDEIKVLELSKKGWVRKLETMQPPPAKPKEEPKTAYERAEDAAKRARQQIAGAEEYKEHERRMKRDQNIASTYVREMTRQGLEKKAVQDRERIAGKGLKEIAGEETRIEQQKEDVVAGERMQRDFEIRQAEETAAKARAEIAAGERMQRNLETRQTEEAAAKARAEIAAEEAKQKKLRQDAAIDSARKKAQEEMRVYEEKKRREKENK